MTLLNICELIVSYLFLWFCLTLLNICELWGSRGVRQRGVGLLENVHRVGFGVLRYCHRVGFGVSVIDSVIYSILFIALGLVC